MEIQGKIKFIGQTEVLGANGFEKRELVITTEEQYPQHVLIQFTQGKCALLDNLKLGQVVNVHFNLKGREWTNPQGDVKYFNTIEGWKIELVQVTNVANQTYQSPSYQAPVQQPAPMQQTQQQPTQTQMFNAYGQAPMQEEEDDLPF